MLLKKNYLKLILLLGILMTSCNNLIYDDLKDCEQGVYLNFYSMTPCAIDSAYVGEVSSLHIFAFDQNEKLVQIHREKNANLNKDYQVLIPIQNGYYTFIAWANLEDSHFTLSEFKVGKTTKKDVLYSLRANQNNAISLDKASVWQGESKLVHLPNPNKYGSEFAYSSINLLEKTNRISIEIEIDESIKNAKAQDFDIALSSANGTASIDGTMPLNSSTLNYPGKTNYTDNIVTTDFTTLDLATGYHNELTIINNKTEEIVFKGDLIGSILLNTINQNINLLCENDFFIKLKLRDKCADCGTYYACEIQVNGWEVHSYEIEF